MANHLMMFWGRSLAARAGRGDLGRIGSYLHRNGCWSRALNDTGNRFGTGAGAQARDLAVMRDESLVREVMSMNKEAGLDVGNRLESLIRSTDSII